MDQSTQVFLSSKGYQTARSESKKDFFSYYFPSLEKYKPKKYIIQKNNVKKEEKQSENMTFSQYLRFRSSSYQKEKQINDKKKNQSHSNEARNLLRSLISDNEHTFKGKLKLHKLEETHINFHKINSFPQFHYNEIKIKQHLSQNQRDNGLKRQTFIQNQILQIQKSYKQIPGIIQEQDKSINQQQLIKNILDRKFKNQCLRPRLQTLDNRVQGMTLFDKLGGSEIIFKIVQNLVVKLMSDSYFTKVFENIDLHLFKIEFERFLSHICGKPIFYMAEMLQKKHAKLKITSHHFNLFKAYLLNSFCQVIENNATLLIEFSQQIESLRYIILNKNQMFAQIYNLNREKFTDQKLNVDGIHHLCQKMYEKIYADADLAPFFEGLSIETQANKFSQILHRLMSWNFMETQNISTQKLRKMHARFQLSVKHTISFKQKFISTLREVGVKDKHIYFLTRRMDGFQSYLLNTDSLKEVIYKIDGKLKFLQKLFKLFDNDSRFERYKQKFGKQFFLNHCSYILQYFTKQYLCPFTDSDILYLHNFQFQGMQINHSSDQFIIEECEIQAFRENFFTAISHYELAEFVISDIYEQWKRVSFLIFNQIPLTKLMDKGKIIKLKNHITQKLSSNKIYSHYFHEQNYSPEEHVKHIVNFIINDLKFYKVSDLSLIHSKLGIYPEIYQLFLQDIINIMNDLDLQQNEKEMIYNSMLSYEKYICMADQKIQSSKKLLILM